MHREWIGILLVVLTTAATEASWGAEEREPTRETRVDDLTLLVPAAWKQQPPANNLRLGQFEIPAAAGDPGPAELAIFNFGAGGGVAANRDRWIEQFQATGRKVQTLQGKCPLGTYVLVDIQGTYRKPVGPPIAGKTELLPDARMLGVILSVENRGLYFLKLAGSARTVAAAAEPLRRAIGAKSADEQPYAANP